MQYKAHHIKLLKMFSSSKISKVHGYVSNYTLFVQLFKVGHRDLLNFPPLLLLIL